MPHGPFTQIPSSRALIKRKHVTELQQALLNTPSYDDLPSAFDYQGRVDAFGDLPSVGNTDGDLYVVGTGSSAVAYIWDTDAWVSLGPVTMGAQGTPGQDGQDGQGLVEVPNALGIAGGWLLADGQVTHTNYGTDGLPIPAAVSLLVEAFERDEIPLGGGAVDSVNGQTGAVVLGAADVLPTQVGQAGKVLGTNGASVSWVAADGSEVTPSIYTNVLDFGAVADGQTTRQFAGGGISGATAVDGINVTMPAGVTLTPDDVGKHITLEKNGVGSVTRTIATVTGAQTCTLSSSSGWASVTGADASWGTDNSAAFQAAIDASYGPIYVPASQYLYKLVTGITLPNFEQAPVQAAAGIIGGGAGGRVLTGTGYLDDVGATLDCTAITGRAISLGYASYGQRVEHIALLGRLPYLCTLSKLDGQVGIHADSFALMFVIRDVYLTGFSNQVTVLDGRNGLIEQVHGKVSGVHGLALSTAATVGVNVTHGVSVINCLFADAGLANGVVRATHHPACVYLGSADTCAIIGGHTDEAPAAGTGSSIWIAAGRDNTVTAHPVFNGNHAACTAIEIGDGTHTVERTRLMGVTAMPYQYWANGVDAVGKGIVINAGAEDTQLIGVDTPGYSTTPAITDTGTRTKYTHVNGMSSAATSAGEPVASAFDGLASGVVAGPIIDTTGNQVCYRKADGTVVCAALS